MMANITISGLRLWRAAAALRRLNRKGLAGCMAIDGTRMMHLPEFTSGHRI